MQSKQEYAHIALGVVSVVVGLLGMSCAVEAEVLEFRITQQDTLDGFLGFFQEMTRDGELWETDFLFEEGEYIRLYAFKMAWQDSFQILPSNTYLGKASSVSIGDSWTSWTGGPTVATVVDTATVSVEAGTFFCYVVEMRSQSGTPEMITWLSEDTGWVMYQRDEVIGTLVDYEITGGAGLYPLQPGNWWTVTTGDPVSVPGDPPRTWGAIKEVFNH